MQSHDWNDLKYLLALHRHGKLADAGRNVGVSETTVARRIRTLEQALGTTLFLRSADGRYQPTDEALQIVPHAESIEASSAAIRAISGESTGLVAGCVRVSAVPIIVNRLLVPGIPALNQAHPGLTIDLVPTADNLDLSKREADLAVRFARPSGGGLRTKAQRLGALSFAAYAASFVSPDECETLAWILYDETHSDLPQARWLEGAAKSSELRASLRVADAETAMHAVAAGVGKTLLPTSIASADPRLRAIEPNGLARFPSREVWLLSHVDQTSRLSITAAKDWPTSLDWS